MGGGTIKNVEICLMFRLIFYTNKNVRRILRKCDFRIGMVEQFQILKDCSVLGVMRLIKKYVTNVKKSLTPDSTTPLEIGSFSLKVVPSRYP